jgi:hypothetical protein
MSPAHPDDVDYWTIEVLDGELSALRWRDAYGDALVEAAHTNLVLDWQWTSHPWGVALELGFVDEDHWLRFRALPVVRAALDAAPDRVSGLLIYPGRGGSQGSLMPRRPRPAPTSAAAAAPLPVQHLQLNIPARLQPSPFQAV